jgi:competence protein ComEC
VMQKVTRHYGTEILQMQVVSVPEKGSYNIKCRTRSDEFEGMAIASFPRTAEIHYGDVIEGEFFLEEPEMVEDFDYKEYLRTQGVFYRVKVSGFWVVEHKKSFFERIALFREDLSVRVRKILPEPHASLSAGLVWGERASMPEEFSQNLSNTGTTHIIAVSGFNVSVIVLLLLKLAGVVHRKYVILLTAFLLFCFLVLVGFDNLPAMRAGIMGYTVLFSKTIGRKTSVLSLLSVAVLVLSILNPLSIFTVSFQLSFAATAGIVGFSKQIEQMKFVSRYKFLGELPATLAAIIATTPVSMLNFETFSVVALMVNLLVLPVVTILTFYSAIVVGISLVSMSLAKFVAYPLILIMNYVISVINFFGRLPFSSITISGLSGWIVGVVYLVMLVMITELSYEKSKQLV